MSMEKPDFRANLERLCERWPNRELIPIREAADFLGVDYRTLLKTDRFPTKVIANKTVVVPLVGLARWLSC